MYRRAALGNETFSNTIGIYGGVAPNWVPKEPGRMMKSSNCAKGSKLQHLHKIMFTSTGTTAAETAITQQFN
jgi:hypothetical protein